MTKEDKQFLLTDLCGRLPYGVKVNRPLYGAITLTYDMVKLIDKDDNKWLPYLRSLSSMTDEEKENLNLIVDEFGNKWMDSESPLDKWKAAFWEYSEATNYLNSIHIDYRGLIEKGLAIEAPEGMYNNKEEQK